MKRDNELEKIKLRFKNYLPEFVLNSDYLKDIFNSQIIESYNLNKYVEKLLKELSITTVTETTINSWEKFAGLNNLNLSLDERVNSIIKKFSFQIHANYFNVLTMLRTYDETTELKEFIDEYRIEIKTKNYISYNDFLNYLSIINNYKPAHLGISVELNREYTMKYYIANIVTNSKVINVSIDAKNDQSIYYSMGIIVQKYKNMVV